MNGLAKHRLLGALAMALLALAVNVAYGDTPLLGWILLPLVWALPGAWLGGMVYDGKRRRVEAGRRRSTIDDWGRLERPRAAVRTIVLRADARAGRRHADEFGFPYAVWDLLEAFWSLDDEKPESAPVVPLMIERPVSDCHYCGVPTSHGRQLCGPCMQLPRLRVKRKRVGP